MQWLNVPNLTCALRSKGVIFLLAPYQILFISKRYITGGSFMLLSESERSDDFFDLGSPTNCKMKEKKDVNDDLPCTSKLCKWNVPR